jgi:hypothetical protein
MAHTDQPPESPVRAAAAEAEAEPCPPHTAGDGAVCRCGAGADVERHGFCASGHPLPGHGAALSKRHGLYALNSSPDHRAFEDAGRA